MTEPILSVRALTKQYRIKRGWTGHAIVRAVDGVDFDLPEGGALGLVGESGSGKTTVARLILGLTAPTAGSIQFDRRDLAGLNKQGLAALRRQVQIVFQNPHSALNPRMTVTQSVGEPLILQERLRGAALARRVAELLAEVGLSEAFLYRYPHELSGGQKQRVCIARALALAPRLLVLDEPTSALDVSVQAQILEFLLQLKLERGLTYLFISHNLAVIRHVCDRVAVMYLGRIVEIGPTDVIFASPSHPYTKALLASALAPRAGALPAQQLGGEVPNPAAPPSGCSFHPRCPIAVPRCRVEAPALAAHDDRRVACHLVTG
jgi:oligopeptide/dipeptide ABC transporter ATP-binding protein